MTGMPSVWIQRCRPCKLEEAKEKKYTLDETTTFKVMKERVRYAGRRKCRVPCTASPRKYRMVVAHQRECYDLTVTVKSIPLLGFVLFQLVSRSPNNTFDNYDPKMESTRSGRCCPKPGSHIVPTSRVSVAHKTLALSGGLSGNALMTDLTANDFVMLYLGHLSFKGIFRLRQSNNFKSRFHIVIAPRYAVCCAGVSNVDGTNEERAIFLVLPAGFLREGKRRDVQNNDLRHLIILAAFHNALESSVRVYEATTETERTE
ncbi:hypothetical protein F5146DRAFT_1152249 [Armillaria mellea]|nr:hypothetical protein F5146DRAFT_1152249 [Armillaria mellea]